MAKNAIMYLPAIAVLVWSSHFGGAAIAADKEKEIIVTCAMSTNGVPVAWAACTAGRLTTEEAQKCMSGQGCFGKGNEITKAMNWAKQALGARRQDEIFIVNWADGGMEFSLAGSNPTFHGTHRVKTHVLAVDQGSLFHMNNTHHFIFQIMGMAYQLENGHSYAIVKKADVAELVYWPVEIK